MNKERQNGLMIRWSLVTAGAIALFWGVWYLMSGSVPVITSIQLTANEVLSLPFGVSRWWDVLIGPIWSVVLIWVFTSKKMEDAEDLGFGLTAGLIAGLAFGLTAGLGAGLDFGLVLGLIFGLAVGIVTGLAVGLGAGLTFGLAFGLVVGLALGLAAGLTAGLVAGLVAGLAAGLTAGLVALIRLVCSKNTWKAFADWLMAR